MNILFVCENYLPHYGGAEVVFKNLAEGYVKQGHHVSLVTHRLKGTKKYEVMNGVKVHRVSCFRSRYLFSFFSIPKIMKLARKAHLIQTTSFNGAPPSWFVGKLMKKPVVITIHETWIDKWSRVTDLSKLSCYIHNFLEKLVYSLNYDKYVCVSTATRKDVLKAKIAPENKTITIYNGFDYNLWNPKRYNGLEIRKKLKLEEKFVYLSCGRPGMSKGFEYLIKAVPEISKKIDNSVLLLLMGSVKTHQKKYDQLMAIIKKLKLSDHVKVIHSVPYEQLGNYLLAADCAVVPSIAEGFGYSAVEACTMNIPLVATNVGSLPLR